MNDRIPARALNSDELAKERTDWAQGRTIMALERTLMAWLRTGLSLISFGFTVYKILEALQSKGGIIMRENQPRNLSLFLILLGMAMLVVGLIEYRSARTNILGDSHKKLPVSMTFIASIGVLLVGVFTVLNIIFGVGGF